MKAKKIRSTPKPKEHASFPKGPLPPKRFLKIIRTCRNRKEWGFCKNCKIRVRVIEVDGHIIDGIITLTVFSSVQIEGHIPVNISRIRSIELLPPFAPCTVVEWKDIDPEAINDSDGDCADCD